MAQGVLWTRTQVGREVLKQCSLIDPSWTGKGSLRGGGVVSVWYSKNVAFSLTSGCIRSFVVSFDHKPGHIMCQ